MSRCRGCPPSVAELTAERVHADVLAQLRWEPDQVSDEVRDVRLAACAQCPSLRTHTCLRCGCYVEFRAALPDKRCPDGRW